MRLLGIPEVTTARLCELVLKVEGPAALAKPAHDARRITTHERVRWHIIEHACLGIDEGKGANHAARANQSVWSDMDPFLNACNGTGGLVVVGL